MSFWAGAIQEETKWMASSCCHGKVVEHAAEIPGSFDLVAATRAMKLGVEPSVVMLVW